MCNCKCPSKSSSFNNPFVSSFNFQSELRFRNYGLSPFFYDFRPSYDYYQFRTRTSSSCGCGCVKRSRCC